MGCLSGLSNLLASLGHTGRRRVVLRHTLNTLWHIITKKSHNVLSKFTMLCWAAVIAILGHIQPIGRGLDTLCWLSNDHFWLSKKVITKNLAKKTQHHAMIILVTPFLEKQGAQIRSSDKRFTSRAHVHKSWATGLRSSQTGSSPQLAAPFSSLKYLTYS